MRARAREIFEAGVRAADPGEGVRQALRTRVVTSGGPLIAVGKAAIAMVKAAIDEGVEASRITVVTNPENAQDVAGADVYAAAHPVPDAVGLAAAEAVEEALRETTHDVLLLLSGGGSALLPAPAKGLTLQDKIGVSELLLASGAEITEMNLVRQALSRLKGGGMLRAAAPARVRALILSDVVGDDFSAIASGPTAPPLGSRADARALLERYGIWQKVSSAVKMHLERAIDAAPLPTSDNTLIGSNTQSLRAMAEAVGGPAHLHVPALTGDVEEAARRVASANDPGIHLFGGETTVTLKGDGKGGRNQELALRVALHLEREKRPWVYLQAGTDGRDGPTDAAGAIVDAERLVAMRQRVDLEALLANNDAYRALDAGGALLKIGGTGTNVADLGVLIRG